MRSTGFNLGKCKVPSKGFKKIRKLSEKIEEVWTSTLESTQDDDEKYKCPVFGSEAMTEYLYKKYKYSVSGNANFTLNAR
jgi:hypothetical protein